MEAEAALMVIPAARSATASQDAPDAVITFIFRQEAVSLVRLARLFVDDRDAAEDLVQEAFLRLRHSLDRLERQDRVVPYLRSIVLNLARDHNRRGLVSLRHRPRLQTEADLDLGFDSPDNDLILEEDQREVIGALRDLPRRQRDCITLRYYLELPVAEIALTLELSHNSVKTHLQRGLAALERRLEATR